MQEFEHQERISDEDFINNYSKRTKHKNRSDRYTKKNDKPAKLGYYFFLGISFIVAYYVFTTYLFVPKI